MNDHWKIFKGTNQKHDGIKQLPTAPPWRIFGKPLSEETNVSRSSPEDIKGSTFKINPKAVELVNAALYLRRPLLVTGRPGTGKSSLAYAIAYELQLGKVLKWPINTRTTLQDGLYRYDAISRLQDAQINVAKQQETDIGKYIQLGALGTAFLPNKRPRVLLIDEIDKSDIDLPNDLLNLFEDGEFEIPELARIRDQCPTVFVRTYDNDPPTASMLNGQVICTEFPLVVMTSNGERDFPPPFLRRCLQLEMPEPSKEQLTEIVQSHFDLAPEKLKQAEELINAFITRRDQKGYNLATDQLLNLIFMLTGNKSPSDGEKETLLNHLLQPLDRVKGDYS